jgi:hypothetical protein
MKLFDFKLSKRPKKMKSFCQSIFIYLFVFSMNGQVNLVPNPSFEDLNIPCSNLPSGPEGVFPWKNACQSPDLFNACFGLNQYSVPIAFNYNYLLAQDGEGYIGLVTYGLGFREMIQTKLLKTLKKDSQYFVSMYVSPRVDSISQSSVFADKFGLAFSDKEYPYVDPNISPY